MENFSKTSQVFDSEILINYIEKLKNEGRVWNDADFCSKVGIPRSYVSDLKAGRKVLNELFVRKVRDAFPDFMAPATASLTDEEPTLGQMYQALVDHDIRFHDLASRILDGMGVAPAKKEKTA